MSRPATSRAALITAGLLGIGSLGGGVPIEAGGPRAQAQIYLRLDFDTGANPFKASGQAEATLVADPGQTLSGGSLHIRRTAEGGPFGAIAPLAVDGASGLRIAFVVRAEAMHSVTVNLFDERRQDNTTPASPARTADESWRPVVLAAEDFHYNSGQPDAKIGMDTHFASLLIHGRQTGSSAAIWVDKLAIYRGPDRTAPGAPSDVRATPESDGTVTLRWQEPADDTFAVVFSIYRREGTAAWQKIAESLQPFYRDRLLSTGPVAYRITAADYDDNVSPPSPEVTATANPMPAAGATAARPAAQVSDRIEYADHLRAVATRRPDVRPDVFLFAGDSITAASRYTQILGSWIARGLTVRQGVGTVTAEYGAANILQYLRDSRPQFAVIMYGTNDIGRGVPISQSMRHLSAIVDVCLEFGTIPILATIPPRGYSVRSQGDQERYNRALVELARKRRVPVSYVFEEMMQHDLKAVLSDGIHLLPERGNDLAGRALRRTMDQIHFALRDTSRSW